MMRMNSSTTLSSCHLGMMASQFLTGSTSCMGSIRYGQYISLIVMNSLSFGIPIKWLQSCISQKLVVYMCFGNALQQLYSRHAHIWPEGTICLSLQEFYCEICGGQNYRGRREFERHFREWRHQNGMRALGIPNNKNFFEITKVKDAKELWENIQVSNLQPAVYLRDSQWSFMSCLLQMLLRGQATFRHDLAYKAPGLQIFGV